MSEILEVKIPENCPVCGKKWHPYRYLKDQNLERAADFDMDQNGKMDDQFFKCECGAVFRAKWILVSFKEITEKQDGESNHVV